MEYTMNPWNEKETVSPRVESIDHVDSLNCFPVYEAAEN
jgi:hypothetical protein